MLGRIKVRNFKSFAEAEVRLRPLTVMIGANASGKTNFIEALGLLGWMARGSSLASMHLAKRNGQLQLRGPLQKLTRHGNSSPIEVEVDMLGASAQPVTLTLGLSAAGSVPQIAHEQLVARNGQTIYQLSSEGDNTATFGETSIQVERTHPVFSHALSGELKTEEIYVLASYLESISIFSPSPASMRGYSDRNDWGRLQPDGSNLSAVIENLCLSGDKPRILEFIRTLPEQDIRDIDFIHVPEREDVMLKLLEAFGDIEHWQEAAVLSDGTLRMLAVAAAMFNGDRLVVIEDIDDGIHPSRLGHMLELLRKYAIEEHLSVLVTTHNPALLDALPDGELRHVVACYRDPAQGDSRLIELGELNEFVSLVSQGPLGQLLTRGIVDRALKHDRTDEERAAAALRWLDQLEAGE